MALSVCGARAAVGRGAADRSRRHGRAGAFAWSAGSSVGFSSLRSDGEPARRNWRLDNDQRLVVDIASTTDCPSTAPGALVVMNSPRISTASAQIVPVCRTRR
jgi:hypothetical protein